MTGTATSPRAARVVATIAMVVGGLAIVPTIIDGAQDTPAAAVGRDQLSADADGVRSIDASVVDGALRIEFADVETATLDVVGSPLATAAWTLERDGSTLVVASPDGGRSSGEAVLTLPRDAEGVDVALDADVATAAIDGRVGDVDVTVQSGSFRADGQADAVTVELVAGEADLDLGGVRTATLTVTAGSLSASLRGVAPESVVLEASAADLDVTVPDGRYRLVGDAADGDLVDTAIRSTASATSTIEARVADSDVSVQTTD